MSPGDCHWTASLCYVPEEDWFVFVNYADDGTLIYKYDSSFQYLGTITLSTAILQPQGITWWRGAFWINSDSTNITYRIEKDGSDVAAMYYEAANAFHEGLSGRGDSLISLESAYTSHGVVRRLDLTQQTGPGAGMAFSASAALRATIAAARYTSWTIAAHVRMTKATAVQNFVCYTKDGETDNAYRMALAWDRTADKLGIWNDTDLWLDAITGKYLSNFADQIVNAAPEGWVEQWATTAASITTKNTGSFGTNCLQMLGGTSGAKYAASITALGSAVTDCEVLGLVRCANDVNHVARIMARGSGGIGTENGYFAYIQPNTDAIGLHKYVGGGVGYREQHRASRVRCNCV